MSQMDYVAAVESRCPGTVKALRGTNAWIDSRDKFSLTYRLSRYPLLLNIHIHIHIPIPRNLARGQELAKQLQGRRDGVNIYRQKYGTKAVSGNFLPDPELKNTLVRHILILIIKLIFHCQISKFVFSSYCILYLGLVKGTVSPEKLLNCGFVPVQHCFSLPIKTWSMLTVNHTFVMGSERKY